MLLNQTKTDDILLKTDQMEDRLNGTTIKAAQDLESVKQTLKLFNDRLNKLEASESKMPKIGSTESKASSKAIK